MSGEIGKHYWLLKRKKRIEEKVEENLIIGHFSFWIGNPYLIENNSIKHSKSNKSFMYLCACDWSLHSGVCTLPFKEQ